MYTLLHGGGINLARAPAENRRFSLPARTDADDDSLSADGTSTGQRQPADAL